MPVNPLKNAVYQLLLPWQAPSPKGQMRHLLSDPAPVRLADYEALLCRHHVLGASLLLRDGEETRTALTSTMQKPVHTAEADTLFRVASITKMATALVVMTLVEEGAFSLDTPVSRLLPFAEPEALRGVTVAQVLSHTSGLRDIPAGETALKENWPLDRLLGEAGIRRSGPGEEFAYCNLNFGLLGCVLEYLTNQPVPEVFAERLLKPLGLRGGLDAARLEKERIMPISRVLPYHEGQDTVIPAAGAEALESADPLHHYHHTAGSLYTNAASLSRLLGLIAGHGTVDGVTLLQPETVRQMVRAHGHYGKADPRLHYGLGLLIVEDRELSKHRLIGHQGYAYGCADGAFYEEGTGRQVVFLNGGCSEARTGRLGQVNRDVLRFALQEEMPAWK